MANLRRSISPQQGLLPEAAPRPRGRGRWPWLALAGALVVLTFAWFDGGEEPVRPIAQNVDLPESEQ